MAAGFDYKTCSVQVTIEDQSEDIAQAVHQNKSDEEVGAGDQVCFVAVLLSTVMHACQRLILSTIIIIVVHVSLDNIGLGY